MSPSPRGKFQIGASEISFIKGRAGNLLLVLHLTPCLASGDHRQARGTHVNVRKTS